MKTGFDMIDPVLDSAALAELRNAAGQDIVEVLFSQIKMDFARLHDAALAQTRHLGPASQPEFAEIHRIVHELKGLSVTVGARELSEACAHAEEHARQSDKAALALALPAIVRLANAVRIALEQTVGENR
jgi:HPt (histidine-containing phosphotransfer) domain-containing protein